MKLTEFRFIKTARLREDFSIKPKGGHTRWNPISPQFAVVWSGLPQTAKRQITRVVGQAKSKRIAHYNRDKILEKLHRNGKLEQLLEKLQKDPNKPLS